MMMIMTKMRMRIKEDKEGNNESNNKGKENKDESINKGHADEDKGKDKYENTNEDEEILGTTRKVTEALQKLREFFTIESIQSLS